MLIPILIFIAQVAVGTPDCYLDAKTDQLICDPNGGASIQLFGSEHITSPGSFVFIGDSSGEPVLTIEPGGEIVVNKNIPVDKVAQEFIKAVKVNWPAICAPTPPPANSYVCREEESEAPCKYAVDTICVTKKDNCKRGE